MMGEVSARSDGQAALPGLARGRRQTPPVRVAQGSALDRMSDTTLPRAAAWRHAAFRWSHLVTRSVTGGEATTGANVTGDGTSYDEELETVGSNPAIVTQLTAGAAYGSVQSRSRNDPLALGS